MSDFRRQFVFGCGASVRWRWTLFEDGMTLIARSAISTRSLDECVAHARSVMGIAGEADLWCAPTQEWLSPSR